VPRGLESVYLISFGEGLLVGVIYSLVNGGTARHPARSADHSGGKADDCRDLAPRRLATVTVYAASLRSDARPSRRAAGSHACHRRPVGTHMIGLTTTRDAPPRRPPQYRCCADVGWAFRQDCDVYRGQSR